MSGRHVTVQVSGSLTYEDDSSSSDEEEMASGPRSVPLNSNSFGIGMGVQEEQDEELEVFTTFDTTKAPEPQSVKSGANGNKNTTLPVPPSAVEEPNTRRLVDLMAASVEKHTGDHAGASASATTAMNTARESAPLPPPPPSTEATKARSGAEDDSEAFGIAYKPYNKNGGEGGAGYSIPGADDDDELRVDVAAKMETLGKKAAMRTASDDNDDDFDIDSGCGSPESSMKIAQLVDKAAAREKEEESAILASLASEMEHEANAEMVVEGHVSGSSGTATKETLEEATADGYDSISNMYQPGAAGDTDVRAELSSAGDVKDKNKGAKVPEKNQADIKTAIVEEEEEAEDEEEEIGDEPQKQGGSTTISADKRKELNSLTNAIEEFDASIPVAADSVPGFGMSEGMQFSTATYADTLAYTQSLDLSAHESSINPFEPRKAIGKSVMTMMGLKTDNRKVDTLAVSEEGWTADELLRWPFLLAQRDYDPSEPRQLLILQSIYRALMGKHGTDPKRDARVPPYAPATGAHWEAIGFQGNDPCTDINRSMKLFALLQALHYVLRHGREAKQSHYLSSLVPEHKDNDTGRDLSWPFMCVSISFTKEAVVALRTGELNGICNEKNSVLEVLFAYHRACFGKFCSLLCDDPLTHHAIHLATIRTACADKPSKFLRAYLVKRQTISSVAKSEALGFTTGTVSQFEFMDVEQQKDSGRGVDEAAAASYLSSNSKAKKFLVS